MVLGGVMKAGELRTFTTVKRATFTYDSKNEKIPTNVTAFTAYAKMITTGGKEFYAAQKLNAETTALFNYRYRSDFKSDMKIVAGNRTFEILSINDVDDKHVELLIAAKEVV